MASVIDSLDDQLAEWIHAQPVFFVASAPTDGGHVNLSPKGHDSLRVLGPRSVAYLDLTGSGAETIAHTRQNGRLTIMLCAFDGPPRIVRLFGTGPQHGLRWLEAHVAGGGPPVIDHVVLIGHGDRPDERYRNLERVLVRHFGLTWRNRYVEIWTRNGAGTTADHKDPGLNLAPPPRGRAE